MADTASDAGPDKAPPPMPPGWIAQWDGRLRKYYFVEISTARSTWEKPTSAAPNVPSPGTTPAHGNPYAPPLDGEGAKGMGEGDRGLGGALMNAYLNKNSNSHQQGLGGLASAVFGGANSHGPSGQHQNNSGLAMLGGLAQSFLSSGQHNQAGVHGTQGAHGSASGSSYGGSSYGYSNSGHNSGTYSGQAPPPSYQASQPQASAPGFQPGAAYHVSMNHGNNHGAQQPYYTPSNGYGQHAAYGAQGYGQQPMHHPQNAFAAQPYTVNQYPPGQYSSYYGPGQQYGQSGYGGSYGGQNGNPPWR